MPNPPPQQSHFSQLGFHNLAPDMGHLLVSIWHTLAGLPHTCVDCGGETARVGRAGHTHGRCFLRLLLGGLRRGLRLP